MVTDSDQELGHQLSYIMNVRHYLLSSSQSNSLVMLCESSCTLWNVIYSASLNITVEVWGDKWFDEAMYLLSNAIVFWMCSSSHSESESYSVVSDSLRTHELYNPWNSPGQNTGVGSLSLLQGIFPTQGLNPGLLHCRQIFYQLSHKGSPWILEWGAHPFSRGSSQPRYRTGVSCIVYQLSC